METLTARLPERLTATGCPHPERAPKNVELLAPNVADLSLNTLPAAPAKLEKLAKRMGYRPRPEAGAREQFLEDYSAHTLRVRAIYNRVFGTSDGNTS